MSNYVAGATVGNRFLLHCTACLFAELDCCAINLAMLEHHSPLDETYWTVSRTVDDESSGLFSAGAVDTLPHQGSEMPVIMMTSS